jgi:hypothetical protein
MEYVQPSIELFGIEINEPVTILTDLLISAVCFYAAAQFAKIKSGGVIGSLLFYYMLTMGLATAIGGIVGHGLMNYLDFGWKLPGWLMSMFSITLIERASIFYAKPLIDRRLVRFFMWLNIIELLTFAYISFSTLDFFYVEVHAAYGLLFVVTSFSIVVYSKTKDLGARDFLVAVFFSCLAALFFTTKWGIGPWFTHFDICHVFMAISSWFFFIGGKRMLLNPY